MIPRIPRMTKTMEMANKIPHRLLLNFLLWSLLRLCCDDHKLYDVVPGGPMVSGGYLVNDRFDLIDGVLCNGDCVRCGLLLREAREANEMASSRSRSSPRS